MLAGSPYFLFNPFILSTIMSLFLKSSQASSPIAGGAFLLSLGISASVNAELLFHEPFEYAPGTVLQDATPALGSEGGWTDTSSGDGTPGAMPVAAPLTVRAVGTNGGATSGQTWTGIPASSLFPNTGGYLEGMRRDNNEGHITLAASVTSQFTDGSTIWLSYVAAATTVEGVNDNHHEPDLAIGSGAIGGGMIPGAAGDDRSRVSQGEAVGATSVWNDSDSSMRASYWDDEAVEEVYTQFPGADKLERIVPQQLIVTRIEFGAETEVITTNVFALDPFVAPSEDDFETGAVSITTVGNLDQSSFDTLSFDAVRTNLDEIRIGTTLADVVGSTAGGGSGIVISTLEKATDSVTITWNSRPGLVYAIDASSSLDTDSWFELDDAVPADAVGEITSYTESVEDGNGLEEGTRIRFYRVRIGE